MSAYKFKNILSSDISFNFSKTVKHVANLNSSALTALICALYQDNDVPLLVICADSVDAHTLLRTLKAIVKRDDIYFFQDWETLPYDPISPHQDIISSRLKLLSSLKDLKKGIILTTVPAIMPRLCPVEYIKTAGFISR